MELLPSALSALARYAQFIIYKVVPDKKNPGKFLKIPLNYRNGEAADPHHDPFILTDANTAITAASLFGENYGVGFVFTKNDPFWFLDIDNCYDPVLQTWSDLSLTLINTFSDAALEVSHSGKGLHLFGSGVVPPHSTRFEDMHGNKLEFYTELRFVALTGISARGNADSDYSSIMPEFINTYFSGNSNTFGGGELLNDWEKSLSEGSRSEWRGPSDDQELISRALRSSSAKAAFGGGATFQDLWEAKRSVLEQVYAGNESSYDAALAQHLCFWTGNDAGRIERLMRQSALVRDKWERKDYLPRTILNARAKATEFLQDKAPEPAAIVAELTGSIAESTEVLGSTFLNSEQQKEFFKGCVYVCDAHSVLVPGGRVLKQDQFNVMFGGYQFVMDSNNEKVTSHAWDAFTKSRLRRHTKADGKCFKPDLPAGAIIEEDGLTLVNSWWPISVPRKKGDPSPFLKHLATLLPNEHDQTILLSYMAACVQHKGVKFQWAPLLQGVEGNGKTLFTWCVAEAVGNRYTHYVKVSEVGKNFNRWMYEKVFIGIEDVYIADHTKQNELIEALKPMITNRRLPIEPKGVDQKTLEVCCNFILNMNPKDGLRKTANDRRFAVLFTAQQCKEDIIRDGLDKSLPALWNWLEKEDGYAIVSELLHTYEIPGGELNPANKQKAPITSSTEEALSQGKDIIEQEILEACEQGILGFRNGWISSMALDTLLVRLHANKRLSHNKRRGVLQSLGYDWHPNLNKGRVNNVVMPDGGKPVLFIKKDHKHLALDCPSEISKAYSDDQTK